MEQRIRQLIKEAMIEKDKNKLITYKSILENAQKIAKTTNSQVTDETVVKAIRNEIKQLNDLHEFCTAGTDRYYEVQEKLKYCDTVLPVQVAVKDIKQYLIINSIDKNIGICMKALKEHFGSSVDGRMASTIAREYITE